mmetsp:Transcript_40007/g.120579  ORF Transcript_40007/g.120579 Transcript_40007/m.120579 type:complete len:293 (-) Transcript_40007:695-1573(-)
MKVGLRKSGGETSLSVYKNKKYENGPTRYVQADWLSSVTPRLLQQLGYVDAEHLIHLLHHLLIQFGKLRQVLDLQKRLTERLDGGEIPPWQFVPSRAHDEFPFETIDQPPLLLPFPPSVRQLLPEVVYDVRVNLDGPGPLDQFVDPSHDGVLGQFGDIAKQIHLLPFEEGRLFGVLEGRGPERSHVHPAHLGGHHDFAEIPHEGAVHSHEMLCRDAVGLVQHDPHLVGVRLHDLNDAFQFVRNVQLVRVEHDDDEIGAFGEPLHDGVVVVIPSDGLLLSRQYAGSIDHGDVP